MKTIITLNPENASEEEVARFRVREAARAIVYDRDGKIGILYVSKENYHKLPGGGVKAGEDIDQALRRECLEEIGCNIEVIGEVGQTVEYRKIFGLKQTSFVYLANLVGEKGVPSFTSKESANGFQVEWLTVEETISRLDSDAPLGQEGKLYIVPRDRALLEAVRGR
jgi:8-oxo-dGTP pyrophosphatase MutT (NUDIX family)